LNSAIYNLENRTTNTIPASYNFWGTNDLIQIASKTFDYYNNINYGKVDYYTYLVQTDTSAPVPPPSNASKSIDGGGVHLQWPAVPVMDLAGYKVYYGSPTGYSFAHVIDVGNVTSYDLAGASLSDTIAITAYDAQADGTNDQIEGHESWFTKAQDYSIPSIPTLIYPSDKATVLSLEPTLIWAPSNGAKKYQLQLSADSLFGSIISDIPNITDLSYKVGPLQSQTVYYWRVRAGNTNGTGAYSNAWSFTTIDTTQSLWNLSNSGTISNLYGIFFINQSTIIAVGEGGTITRTTDGGATWFDLISGTTNTLYGVFFTDSLSGTAVGSGGTILRTSDQGTNWSLQNSTTSLPLYSVFFSDDSSGTVVGGGGIILNTTNRGETWQVQSSAQPASVRLTQSTPSSVTSSQTGCLLNVLFVNSLNGYAVGGSGALFRTTDGGKAWSTQATGTTNDLWACYFVDQQNGIAVGTFGTILRTTNGGTIWSRVSSGTTNHLNAVHFSDAATGIAVGAKGTVLRTTNGGQTWSKEDVGTANWLRGVASQSKNSNSIVGSNGLILQPSGRTVSVEGRTPAEISMTYQLHQNYPNPFNPSTIIQYSIPRQTRVTLTIFDILGRQVAQLEEGVKQAGRYEVQWNASGFPSGVYFYRLQAGSFTETKKLLLLK
jgi:photosystem II stability/assembly factor-like uncharacterized protein